MNRTEFLTRIRQAREHLSPGPEPTTKELDLARRVPAELERSARVKMFADRVQGLGMFPHLTSAGEWTDTVRRILNERGGKDIRVTFQPPLDDDAILERLSGPDRTVTRWQSGPQAFATDVGISVALGGIAEIGTVLIGSDPRTPRQVTLVPPHVIVLVMASSLAADLTDALGSFPGRLAASPGANLTLVTGPSKTSDIEKTLVTGVHGPGIMDVVILQDR